MKPGTYYSKNKLKRQEYAYLYHLETKKFVASLKSAPCTDCGRTFPPECMDFDHVPERGTKYKEINLLVRGKRSFLEEELKKCDLVCACCHRTRSKKRQSWYEPPTGTQLAVEDPLMAELDSFFKK